MEPNAFSGGKQSELDIIPLALHQHKGPLNEMAYDAQESLLEILYYDAPRLAEYQSIVCGHLRHDRNIRLRLRFHPVPHICPSLDLSS
jgi:hypothetical protein